MPEVEDRETIRSGGTRIAAIPDGLGDCVGGEGIEVMIEGVGLGDGAAEAAGVRGLGVRGDVGELFGEMEGDVLVGREGAAGEGDWLVGWVVGIFPLDMLDVGPELGRIGGVGAGLHFVGPDLAVGLDY